MASGRNPRKRATVYLAVLGAAMILTVIGFSALAAVRVQRRAAESTTDFAAARLYAQSAIELGLLWIDQDANWRETYTSGVWVANGTIGDGKYTLEGVDPNDNDLTNSQIDTLILTATGVKGAARYKLSVELGPEPTSGMNFLESAIHVETFFRANLEVTADAPISSNGWARIDGTVNGNVEAVGSIQVEGTLNGTATEGIDPKEVPDATVFDFYVANAASISFSALPLSGGFRELSNTVISPGYNPHGPTHTQGLYKIDCQGEPLLIRDVRVHGSLVILDPGDGSRIDGAVNWEPFDAGLPALLVRGSIEFRWSGTLDEASLSTNFNPPGSPYPSSGEDTDIFDAYPSIMKGLIAVSSDLRINAAESIMGVIFNGGAEMRVDNTLDVTHDPTIIANPPPGFELPPKMRIVSGTWRQVVD
ncbi:MAG: hypothetical protein IH986_13590 [Planctomycetes bacterium]|nr:hypothetical protein [Planctomycetota bacterium]